MSVVMDAYDIPPTIAEKLLTGEYKRVGSVVRHAVGANKGQIVKHLDPVDIPKPKAAEGTVKKIYNAAKNNKKATIIVGAATGIIVVSTAVYQKYKRAEPKVLRTFNKTFKEYIEAIRTGTLNVDLVDEMSTALSILKSDRNYKKFEIELSADDVDVLIGTIRDFTIELAETNNVEILEEEYIRNNSSVIDFQRYLDIQKKVFEVA